MRLIGHPPVAAAESALPKERPVTAPLSHWHFLQFNYTSNSRHASFNQVKFGSVREGRCGFCQKDQVHFHIDGTIATA